MTVASTAGRLVVHLVHYSVDDSADLMAAHSVAAKVAQSVEQMVATTAEPKADGKELQRAEN